jgi:hypothetical protein
MPAVLQKLTTVIVFIGSGNTLKHCNHLYDVCVKYRSYMKCHKSRWKYFLSICYKHSSILQVQENFSKTASIPNSKKTCKRHVLHEEKSTGWNWCQAGESPPKIFVSVFTANVCFCLSTNCNRTTKFASTVVHRLCDTACEARNKSVNWYLHVVHAEEMTTNLFWVVMKFSFISPDLNSHETVLVGHAKG